MEGVSEKLLLAQGVYINIKRLFILEAWMRSIVNAAVDMATGTSQSRLQCSYHLLVQKIIDTFNSPYLNHTHISANVSQFFPQVLMHLSK